ncbi:MAG: HD-GYP domain-containing protein [Phycisphaerae bacterium]|nr:HD-GYP domain-containing protein [Phycisphaerae bacterium]
MRKPRICADAGEVVRPVSISLVAMGVAAGALAVQGWGAASWLLTGVVALLAVGIVLHVRWAVRRLGRESTATQRSALQAERHYIDVLRSIIRHVDTRDAYWEGHSDNVGRLSRQIAEQMHLPDERCELLGLAGELHDLGMLTVPEEVLLKRHYLGAEEFGCVRKHSKTSYDLLKALTMLQPVLPAIRYHHERMNGSGYPEGLVGAQVPLGARIIAVADTYDAMTHDRPYRPAMSSMTALSELQRCAPSAYDPACVAALAEVVNLTAVVEPKAHPAPGAAARTGDVRPAPAAADVHSV